MFGKQRTDSVDVRSTLSHLLHSPGGLEEQPNPQSLPERLLEEMDGLDRAELRGGLADDETIN